MRVCDVCRKIELDRSINCIFKFSTFYFHRTNMTQFMKSF